MLVKWLCCERFELQQRRVFELFAKVERCALRPRKSQLEPEWIRGEGLGGLVFDHEKTLLDKM